jgi:hypothetical protein
LSFGQLELMLADVKAAFDLLVSGPAVSFPFEHLDDLKAFNIVGG